MDEQIATMSDTKKINVEIDEHQKECQKTNDLKFMSKVFFNLSMLGVMLAIISGVAFYLKAESGQNERLILMEQLIQRSRIADENQYSEIIRRLESIQKEVRQ